MDPDEVMDPEGVLRCELAEKVAAFIDEHHDGLCDPDVLLQENLLSDIDNSYLSK